MSNSDKFQKSLPASAIPTFERLLASAQADDTTDPETLRVGVDRYVESVAEAAQTRSHLDPAFVAKIGKSCHALLDMFEEAEEPHQSRLIAAVQYFLLPRDGDDDLAYEDGFDDDAQVINAVVAAMGRHDLHVPIPQRGNNVNLN
jgi:uncharacterized membrane protein YkvA (DUF1232 family)